MHPLSLLALSLLSASVLQAAAQAQPVEPLDSVNAKRNSDLAPHIS